MVQFDLLPRPPGLPTGDLQLWFIPHPLARRRRQFSDPELLIDLIYVFFGCILLSAILISVQWQNETFSELL